MSSLSIALYFPFKRVKVVAQGVHDRGAVIELAPDRRWHPLCHQCGTPAATVHSDGHRRVVRDLNLVDRQVFLQLEHRKVWCPRCAKARVEHLEFCDASQRLTHRMRRYIYDLCKVMTVADVADHLDLDPKTVKAIDKEFLQQEFGQTDYRGLRLLAIDEISFKKGRRFMTVVLDYHTGRVVWMGEGHDIDTLDRFFAGMTAEQKAGIQAVAMDIWGPYINRIEHHCPQALIVLDHFHVVKAYSRVIDEVRREEVRNATAQDRPYIKGSRYLLLKNRQNLTVAEEGRLEELLRVNKRINQVYVLKDQLKVIYDYHSPPAAKAALDDWCSMAQSVDNWWMGQFVKTLRKYEREILNHCKFPIGTSPLEGVNNKIKVIKRKAYGFHDPEYFALKVKQAFPGHAPRDQTGNLIG